MTAAEISCSVCGYQNPPQRFCGDCGARLPVVCSSCGAENPGDKRHCGACGALLPGHCASCGADNPAVNRFCFECGQPLSSEPSADALVKRRAGRRVRKTEPESGREERRLVTALFCDLVGFTPLSEK